ncbi:MAG: response regulator [Candidatus Omnitrophota bacterium]
MVDAPRIKGTILFVDDEEDLLWFLKRTYQPLGYETLTAGSGLEALKIVEECGEKINLVILDLKMPGMGGIEVLKSIRRHYPKLPVIILTAFCDREQECEDLGIEAFIKKPYSLKELDIVIERVFESNGEEEVPVEVEPGYELCAKILIVDDEEEVCDFFKTALVEDVSDAHFEVRCALRGDDALRISREFEPDIGIIDIKMPYMWGDELIERFKAGEGCSPKDFVIFTAVDGIEELKRAKKLGHRIFAKPTDFEKLVEVLKKICVRHKLLRKKV